MEGGLDCYRSGGRKGFGLVVVDLFVCSCFVWWCLKKVDVFFVVLEECVDCFGFVEK